jgi:hypothetical protein
MAQPPTRLDMREMRRPGYPKTETARGPNLFRGRVDRLRCKHGDAMIHFTMRRSVA